MVSFLSVCCSICLKRFKITIRPIRPFSHNKVGVGFDMLKNLGKWNENNTISLFLHKMIDHFQPRVQIYWCLSYPVCSKLEVSTSTIKILAISLRDSQIMEALCNISGIILTWSIETLISIGGQSHQSMLFLWSVIYLWTEYNFS